MEKQPDKTDVLMEWFLGEHREITEAMKVVADSIESSTARLETASRDIIKASESSKIEVIDSHRELAATLKKESKAADEFLARLARSQTAFSERLVKRILLVTVICSFVGALIGAGIVSVLLR